MGYTTIDGAERLEHKRNRRANHAIALSILVLTAVLLAFILVGVTDPNAMAPKQHGKLPNGLLFVFARHGQSTWNVQQDSCTNALNEFCSQTTPALPDPVVAICKNRSTQLDFTAKEISKNETVGFAMNVVEQARDFMATRMNFDAPLTEEGIAGATALNKQTSSLQQKWLDSGGAIMATSNLIRAVDTMMIGFDKMINKDNNKMILNDKDSIVLVDSLQEFSQTGKGDPVSVYLPVGFACLQKDNAGSNNCKDGGPTAWQTASNARNSSFVAAKRDMKDIAWINSHTNTTTTGLKNYDMYLPNDQVGVNDSYRTEPDVPMLTNQRLPGEYDQGTVHGSQRFAAFTKWMVTAVGPPPDPEDHKDNPPMRVVVTGHSNWYKLYVDWLFHQKNMQLDDSCTEFKDKKLKNQAAVEMKVVAEIASCTCVFDGQTAQGALKCT